MKKMTNEQKAQELSEKAIDYIPCNSTLPFYLNALKMAKWKDQQFKEHNDELINKACEIYIKELNTMNRIVRLITSDQQNLIKIDESVEEFRKLLES